MPCAIDPAEARRIFNEHAEAFAKYRSRLRGGGRESHRGQGQSAASGTVSRSGDTGAASAASAQDRLRLSNGQDGGGASRRPGRCQGVRRTRDGRCAGAGDVAGNGRVEQGGGRAGRGRTGRCDGRWRCCGIGGCCRRCGPGGAAGSAGAGARRGRWGGWIWRCGRRGRYRGIRRRGGGAGAAGSTGATGAAGAAGSTAATAPPGRQERRRGRRRGFEFCCGSGGRRGCCGFRRRRFGCGPGRRFRRFGTRRQERCGPEAVRSAGRRAVRLTDNLLVIVTAVLALLVFIIAWALRRAARRGDDDEETYAYAEPALDTAALNRKLETISLDRTSRLRMNRAALALPRPDRCPESHWGWPTTARRQGWQTQPHGQTVQDTLEAALASFCGVPGTVPTICAGRTDTGVHGAMQVVHLDTALDRRMESWVRGVNAFLPPSISVQWARQVPDDFHARFSARSRTYVYLLCAAACVPRCGPGAPAWCFQPLDVAAMRGRRALLGEHDFSSFRSSQCRPSIRCATCIAGHRGTRPVSCFYASGQRFPASYGAQHHGRAAAGRAGQGTGGMDGAAAVLARPQARRADLRA